MIHHVLVVDTDAGVASAVRAAIDDRLYRVQCAYELEEAEARLSQQAHSLVIVDTTMFPSEARQHEFVRFVKRQSVQTRIMFLAASMPNLRPPQHSLAIDGLLPKRTHPTLLAGIVDCMLSQR